MGKPEDDEEPEDSEQQTKAGFFSKKWAKSGRRERERESSNETEDQKGVLYI